MPHRREPSIRYAQCWEDADVLLEALQIQPGDRCLSIASAGDNTLSMLVADPERIDAIDSNPAQLACLALRIAAYQSLQHDELLELIGSRHSTRRRTLYKRCRPRLAVAYRQFWDCRPALIDMGIGAAGRFERYFAVFRRYVLPLIHSRRRVEDLLTPKAPADRLSFYRGCWNNHRWRLLFRIFFSRWLMSRLGRDPAYFAQAAGPVAERIFNRAEHALTRLQPAENPYLQWILTGRHRTALPHALRAENFECIRSRVDRVHLHCTDLAAHLADTSASQYHRWNLSDVFEYVPGDQFESLYELLLNSSTRTARLVYWNMLVDRTAPTRLSDRITAHPALAQRLQREATAFFYGRLVVESVA
jgi:S-adenosylmethionine-diacylglycerol 3-amino-3-carboxypropyl transferase